MPSCACAITEGSRQRILYWSHRDSNNCDCKCPEVMGRLLQRHTVKLESYSGELSCPEQSCSHSTNEVQLLLHFVYFDWFGVVRPGEIFFDVRVALLCWMLSCNQIIKEHSDIRILLPCVCVGTVRTEPLPIYAMQTPGGWKWLGCFFFINIGL